MSEIVYNGDDLLKVFNDLNVDLDDVSPNVIHSWFDTDCEKTRDLLNWMCSALTRDNCLTPQEAFEWSQIKNPLSGQELQRAVEDIETAHPGIFDYESNQFNNDVLRDELEIVEDEKRHYERQLEINVNINRNLSKTVSNLESQLNQLQLEKREIEEKYLEIGKKLEESHEKLYKQISLFVNNHIIKSEQFLHNFGIEIIESNYQETVNSINSLLNDENAVEFVNNSENIQNYSDISQRIVKSKLKLFHKEMLKYSRLNCNFVRNESFIITDEGTLEVGINKKENLKNVLFKDIETIVQKEIDNLLLQPKLIDAKHTLSVVQSKSQHLEKIGQIIEKILLFFVEILILFNLYNTNIENIEELFRNMWNYINVDLENSNQRTELLENIQEKTAVYQMDFKPRVVHNIARILQCDNDNLLEIIKTTDTLAGQIQKLEKKLFVDQLTVWKDSSNNLLSEIKRLKQTVISGPTCRIEIIPLPLQNIFKQIDSNSKRREDALKLAINDYKEVSILLSDRDGQNRRQLWVYFLENPQKVLMITEQNQ